QISVGGGDNQTALAGSALPTPPSVLVTDDKAQPVVGVAVMFAVTSGGGGLTGAGQTTDASGIATVGTWMLGRVPGTNTLTATATGSGVQGNPVTFTATGTPVPPAHMAINAG